MLTATLRTAFAHKGRLVLSTLAVVLGVAFVTGTLMLTNALDRTFVDIIEGSAQDVQVTREPAVGQEITTDPGDSAPLLLSDDAVATVQGVPGVSAAAGGIAREGVYLIDSSGEVAGAVGPPAIGLNWESDPELNTNTLTAGRAPERKNEVAVDDVTFGKLGIAIGEPISVVTPSGTVDAELVGTFKFGETGGLAGATLAAFEPKQAQQLLAEPGYWTAIDVAVAEGYTDEQVAASIQEALGDGDLLVQTRAEQVEQQSDELREGLAFFNYIMVGFAAIALFVAAFLIYNTFSILIAQRGQELALLRAIGATRVQVLRSVLVEVLIVAVVSVILGVGLGYLLALGLAALFDSFGLSLTAGIGITASAVLWAALVGIVVTLLAAIVPAYRAGRIKPVAAMREIGASDERIGKVRTAVGVVFLLATAALMATGLASDDGGSRALLVALGTLLLLISVVILAPLLSVIVVSVIGPLFSLLGRTTGRLSVRNALRSPKRMATTASALTIGLGLVVAVTVITSSAKASLGELVDQSFGAEFVVGTTAQQPFSTEVADEIRNVDGVEYVISESGGPVSIDGEETGITAVGGGPLDEVYSVEDVSGDFGQLESGQAVVNTEYAKEQGWDLGSEVRILFPSGDERSFEIVGIYASNGLIDGLVIPLDDYREVGGASQDRSLYVTLTPQADTEQVLADIEAVADTNPLLQVLDQTELKEQTESQLNQLLYLVYAMLALSVVIAAMGVVNTLALSVIERTREIGLLRAVGATRRQIRAMIRAEAILMAVLGAILGIAVGVGAGLALQRAMADAGIDVLDIPIATLIVILVLAIIIGVVAAAVPARRAAKLDILKAIATE